MNVLIDVATLPAGMATLAEIEGVQVVAVEPNEEAPRELPADVIGSAELLFCTYPPLNLEDMPDLRFIQICSSGFSQLIDLGLPQRGIRAANASGVFDTAIAEWIIAMMINLRRDLRGLIRNQEAGIFDRDARFQRDIRGSRLGIWGYGGIGRQTAKLAKALGLTVWVYAPRGVRPRPNHYLVPGAGDPEGVLPDRVFTAGQEIEFLDALDFLALTMPLTPATQGIIGQKELKSLPATAFLLNPARGHLIDEQALLRALCEQWIAGAALDAHYAYPLPADHPLWRFTNVIMTPHISGSSEMPYFLERTWDIFIQNVRRIRGGQPLLNELSAEQLRPA